MSSKHEKGIDVSVVPAKINATLGRAVQPTAVIFEATAKGLTDIALGVVSGGLILSSSMTIEHPKGKKGAH